MIKIVGRVFEKYNKPCALCGTIVNLTRHHVKDMKGRKTGQIQILCRECHNQIEEEYRLYGIVKPNLPPKLTRNEELHLQYMNGLIPFYSINRPTESQREKDAS